MDPEFRLHHDQRCSLLRKHKLATNAGFELHVKWQRALSIKRKYKHLRTPRQPMLNSVMLAAIATFRENVSHGPTYVCTVCHRTMFPNQVKPCKREKYSANVRVAEACLTGSYVHVCDMECSSPCFSPPERLQEWICHNCDSHLSRGKIPTYAVANNLELAPIPPELAELNVLERQLIAKILPFAKIIALPKGQQRAVKGAVVCVPSEVESVVNSLPRSNCEAQLLQVKLKRHIRFKGYQHFYTVNMTNVLAALAKLREQHSEYTDVTINEEATFENLFHEPAEDRDLQHGHVDAAQWGDDGMLDEELLQASESYAEPDQADLTSDAQADQQDQEQQPYIASNTDKLSPEILSGDVEGGTVLERSDDEDSQHDPADAAQWGEDILDEVLLQVSDSQIELGQADLAAGSIEEQQEELRPGLALDTCMQPPDIAQEILSYGDGIFSIAPAQGNKPVGFFAIPKLEAMAFPIQFPTGENTLDDDRPVKLSPSRYFNARLFGADTRFAEDQSYLFFAQFVTETHIARGSMSIQMRKGKARTKDGRVVKNSMLQNKEELDILIQGQEATRFMQPLRGTPAYWNKSLKDVHAMLRQIGKPTFFLTFSAAEMRWPEVIEVIKAQQGQTLGDISALDWKAKCDVLRSNPVTVMRMFEKRVDSLMADLILSPARPIGEVEDYFYRVEFQARGSPHIHMLVWVRNAPVYGEDTDWVVCQFIDKYITCQMPDPETDPELYNIVSEVQVHSRNHSASCRKGNVTCRFGFPKLPMDTTWITDPHDESLENDGKEGQDPEEQRKAWREGIQRQQKEAKAKLQGLRSVLMDPKAEFESLSDLLRHCNLDREAYMKYAKNLTSSSVILLKRHPNSCWVNAYNPDLLRAWNANMDIQYVLDDQVCAMYMMSYITKPEHEMSEFLKSVIDTTRDSAINQREEMSTIMQAYSKHRQVSAQEAVARTCSLRLKKSSRSVIFLNTDEEGMKMSLPMSRLKDMEPESDEVWMSGVPDKYLYRPQTPEFEHMCLAEFASDYRVVYGQQTERGSAIALLDDKGFIAKRTAGKPAIIRFTRFSETKAPEKHYRRLLKMYLPHRSDYELKDKGHPTYEEFYKQLWVKSLVDRNVERYEGRGKTIDKALQNIKIGPTLNAWNTFAPEVEVDRDECLDICEAIPDEGEEDAVPDYQVPVVGEPVPRIEAPRLSSDFVSKMFRSLNETQACVFYSVRQWCLQRVWGQDPEPFHYFVSGGAGCGKSHVIKCIYEEATRILRELPRFRDIADMSQPAVLLTAFTGTAAFNISGKTLHSVLKLPRSLEPPYQGLGNTLDEVRAALSSVEILIIDEISMVSKKLFAYVNWRFQQIKGNRSPFGGISVLAVGDFYQLPPLGGAKPLCVYEETEFDLWRDHFSMINLTEIMRQKDDRAFAELLNRLRVKSKQVPVSNQDRDLLMQAITNSKDCPAETLHVFATNKQVDSHNAATVATQLTDVVDLVAADYKKDVATGKKVLLTYKVKGTKRDLPDSILAAQGARVMLIRNLDVEDGLVNGTFGTISNIVTDNRAPSGVKLLGLQLDNLTAGQTLRKKLLGPSDNLVYLERSEESIGKKGGVVRRQFPLKLAFACTAHKVQGMTVTSAVVSLKSVFQPGMAYVALSRTTSLAGLTVTDFDEKKIYADPDIMTALEHMRSASFQSATPLLHHLKWTEQPGTTVTIVHHNAQGLPSHIVDLRAHHELRLADVLCLTETHLSGSPESPFFDLEGYTMFERSRRASYDAHEDMVAKAGGGVAMYCKSTLKAEVPRCMQHVTDMECLVLKVEVPVKVLIATVYRPPNYSLQNFLPNLNTLLDTLELMDHQPIVVCGDFNEDLLSRGKKSIRDALLSRGYTQLIVKSTTDKNTLIDHIYISQPATCVQSGVLQTYYSYHNPVYCVLTG
ncbi:uncharacterized protein LOC141807175 [Halichoeres trimaculatus]|uniref:uncharacterized protein LOC141807175 n=1 Tax=Halichoeres trimaculatus TaxID=147232 RepID=UPI003D9DCA47